MPTEPIATVLKNLAILATASTNPQADYWLAQAEPYLDIDNRKSFMLRVLLTPAEHLELIAQSQQAGQTMSDYVREKVFPADA